MRRHQWHVDVRSCAAFPVITTHQTKSLAALLEPTPLSTLNASELAHLDSALRGVTASTIQKPLASTDSVAHLALLAARTRLSEGKVQDALVLFALAAHNGVLAAAVELAEVLLRAPDDSGFVEEPLPPNQAKAKEVVQEIRALQRQTRRAMGEPALSTPATKEAVAVQFLRRAAKLGFGNAAVLLADLPEHCPRDEVMVYLSDAADCGDAACSMRLALMLLDDEHDTDLPYVIRLLRRAAMHDYTEAHLYLGHMIKTGQGVPAPDPAQAADHLRRASELGDAEADLYLSRWAMEDGNVAEALSCLTTAVERGNSEAMHLMGNALMLGDYGLDVDVERAKKLYEAAGQGGRPEALISLGALLIREQAYAEAFQAYQRAATMGSAEAWSRVADMHERGLGVTRDVELAAAIRKTVGPLLEP